MVTPVTTPAGRTGVRCRSVLGDGSHHCPADTRTVAGVPMIPPIRVRGKVDGTGVGGHAPVPFTLAGTNPLPMDSRIYAMYLLM